MKVPHAIGLALVFMLVLGIAARAGDSDKDQRTYWRHKDGKGGHYEKADGDRWLERSGPKKFFDFEEKARNDKFIEIYDPKRHITLRLYDDRVDEKRSGKFVKLYEGLWGKPQ
jgi:hypothetical protein